MRPLPALKVVICLAAGIIIGAWTSLSPALLAITAILALTGAIILDRRSVSNILLAVSLVTVGGFAYKASLPPDKFKPIRLTITGRIAEPPVRYNDQTAFPLDEITLQFLNKQPVHINKKVWLKIKRSISNLEAGKYITTRGTLRSLKPKRNPCDFNLKSWRERNGYFGILYGDKYLELEIHPQSPSLIFRIRNSIASSIDRYISSEASLIKALLLGIRRELDPSLVEALRTTGLSHLLALSGLHIGFLVAILIGLGAILRLPVSGRALMAICGIFLYMLIVPPRASTLRAAIMAAMFLSSPVLKRWSPPLNSLAVASLIILCFRPEDLFDAGFQLSFAAIGGIILFNDFSRIASHFLTRWGGWFSRQIRRFVLVPFFISCAATIMILPLTSCLFGRMALGAPVFNLVAIPLLGFIFAGAWIMVVSSMFCPYLTDLIADGLIGVITVWKKTAFLLADFAPTWTNILTPLTITLILLALIWLAVGKNRLKFRFIIVTLTVATLLIWNGNCSILSRFQIWFLDVGQGDAAIWLFPKGQTVVIDGGPSHYTNRQSVVTEALTYFKRKRIDILAVSHPEEDHIGGLIEVIDRFPIGLALASPTKSTTETYKLLMKASKRNHVQWKIAHVGDMICGLPVEYSLKVKSPPYHVENWSSNNASLTLLLKVQTSPESISNHLTTGDIEKRAESRLAGIGGIQAGLLKAPHHGSFTSCTEDFINVVDPDFVVISRGYRYEKIVSRKVSELKARGIEVLQTVDDGAILFVPDRNIEQGGWKVVDWRQPSFFRWLFGLH